jgi:hypothetical protein|nr:MAG TPA: hypothetical protein [Caudoviricetes sp.]
MNQRMTNIYNIHQANKLYQNGAKIVSIGKNNENKIYVKFIHDQQFQLLLEKWFDYEL